MRTLYLIRHARATGQPAESPLTPEGRADALRLAEQLATAGIERIVASPYLRAQQTAAPLAERLKLPITTDYRLAERVLSTVDLPDWQQKLQASFADPDLCFPGGESSRQARARAVAAVTDIITRGAGTTAIVSHGNLLTLLLGHFDRSYGYDDWATMKSPDIFQVMLADGEGARVAQIRT